MARLSLLAPDPTTAVVGQSISALFGMSLANTPPFDAPPCGVA